MYSGRNPPINFTRSLSSNHGPVPSSSPTSPTPTSIRPPAEVRKSLSAHQESLIQRIAQHDKELRRLGREIRASKPGSRTRCAYKKRAVQVLKQKRSMEKRLEHAMDMSYKVAAAADAVEEAKLMRETQICSGVSGVGERVTSEELEEVVEEMRENVEDAEEIRVALEGDWGLGGVEFDEEEMGRELDEEVRINREREGGGETYGEETEEGLNEFIANLERQVPDPYDEILSSHDPTKNETERVRRDSGKEERGKG